MSGAFTDADYERMVRERDEALARVDSQRSQIAFYRTACTARFLPEGFGDETIRELINDLMEDRDDARSTIEDLNDEIARGREAIRIYRTETEAAKRERDLALGRLENEIKAAKQARMAEERARESLDELDAAIYDCLPSDYDDDSPLDCVEHAADRLRDLAQERDEHKAKREEYAAEARSLRERLKDAYRERDEARVEVERLRAEAAPMNEHFTAGYRDGYRDAYRRGAEAMREACAAALMADGLVLSRERAANVVRALPIPEEP